MVNEDDKNGNDKDDQTKLAEHEESRRENFLLSRAVYIYMAQFKLEVKEEKH
jgi:hypothetical protein